MNFKKNQALWTSVILHLSVLVALFLSTLVHLFQRKEPEHVFQMMDPPGAASSVPTPDTPSPPEPQPPRPTDLASVPDVVLPKPQPQPEPQPAPQPKPQPQPEPQPQPKLQSTSYADFIKQNPIKDPVQRKPPPRTSVKVPTIDTSKVRASLQGLLQNQSRVDAGMSAQQQDALTQYGARLNAQLNRAWLKPSSLAGVRLVATVIFDVSSAGRISNVRLRPASGNSAFDASVLAAFRQVAGAGATPTGNSHTFTMSFRMVE